MNWTDYIAGCFGETDKIFAGHASEEERAFELLKILRKENEMWRKVRAEFVAYLEGNVKNEQHIRTEILKVEKYYRCWLRD
ncbi:hypothetical protein [Martelella mediterranea]|uniref:Uncharacterized protein n=1 Tax=Martelella mediterranea TaxID=293089 RepID=A0A4R3NCP7_9HYPH|nr:hypothetical protein [Martelella mediterranea]TCT27722.1 hypothetical protein EDC90_10779 [Martelella mediterranea]